jgi:hypothetical protein
LPQEIEQLLALLRREEFLFGKDVIDDQLLHAPLPGQYLLLLGCDLLHVGLWRGKKVEQFQPRSVHLLADSLRFLAECGYERLDALPLLLIGSQSLMQWALHFTGTQLGAKESRSPEADKGHVQRYGQDNQQ